MNVVSEKVMDAIEAVWKEPENQTALDNLIKAVRQEERKRAAEIASRWVVRLSESWTGGDMAARDIWGDMTPNDIANNEVSTK